MIIKKIISQAGVQVSQTSWLDLAYKFLIKADKIKVFFLAEHCMREDFLADWAFSMQRTINQNVKQNYAQYYRLWPLLQTFDFDGYLLPEGYAVVLMHDKLSGVPAGPGVAKNYFPFDDYPVLPPRVEDLNLWNFYFAEKLGLSSTDIAFLIPLKDSGCNSASKDYELFTVQERQFWSEQFNFLFAKQLNFVKGGVAMAVPSGTVVTNNFSVEGQGARLNIHSSDSSVNTIAGGDISGVFAQAMQAAKLIDDPTEQQKIESAIRGMQEAHGTSGFVEKYQNFIGAVANHLAVFGPLLPAFTQMLSSSC